MPEESHQGGFPGGMAMLDQRGTDLPKPLGMVQRSESLDTWGACMEALESAGGWGNEEISFSDDEGPISHLLKDVAGQGLRPASVRPRTSTDFMSTNGAVPAIPPNNRWGIEAPSASGDLTGPWPSPHTQTVQPPLPPPLVFRHPLAPPPLDTSYAMTQPATTTPRYQTRHSKTPTAGCRNVGGNTPAHASGSGVSTPFEAPMNGGGTPASSYHDEDNSDSESDWENEHHPGRRTPGQKRGRKGRSNGNQDVKRLKKNQREQRRANKINDHINTLRDLLEDAGVVTQPTKSSILSEGIAFIRNVMTNGTHKTAKATSRTEQNKLPVCGDEACSLLFQKSATALAIASADHLGHFVTCNSRFARVFGCEAKDLTPPNTCTPYSFTAQQDLLHNHKVLSSIKAGEVTSPCEVVLCNPQGRRFLISVTALKSNDMCDGPRYLIFEPKAAFVGGQACEEAPADESTDASGGGTPRAVSVGDLALESQRIEGGLDIAMI